MKVLITAGGTSEAIDAVRSIKNEASGKLGMFIAKELLRVDEDTEIHYVHDPKAFVPEHAKISSYPVVSVSELEKTMHDIIKQQKIQFVIHTMAVSDYQAQHVVSDTDLQMIFETWNTTEMNKMNYSDFIGKMREIPYDKQTKIGSKHEQLFITLGPTTKVIEQIKKWDPNIHLIGFKLLQNVTQETLIDVAYKQLLKNDEILVVANDKTQIDETKHHALIINRDKTYIECDTKEEIARCLVQQMQRF